MFYNFQVHFLKQIALYNFHVSHRKVYENISLLYLKYLMSKSITQKYKNNL